MADWQYRNPSDISPNLPIDRGYAVGLHNVQAGRKIGVGDPTDHKRYTARLSYTDIDIKTKRPYMTGIKLWIHQMDFSYAIGGQYAQSVFYREWYPRNMQAPTVRMTGQTANQYQYGRIAEWIRGSQKHCLSPLKDVKNTVRFEMPSGGIDLVVGATSDDIKGFRHMSLDYEGHIRNIQRRAERFNNRPEFTFDFVITTVNNKKGLFMAAEAEADAVKGELAHYMRFPSHRRRENEDGSAAGPYVKFRSDPDKAKGAAGYSKGKDRPD